MVLDEVRDPSAYLNDAYYEATLKDTSFGRKAPDAPELAEEIGIFLLYEARLLDDRRYDEWLGLWTEDSIYWLPAQCPPGDPRQAVSLTLDDKRRLLDRVSRLQSGYAYSQIPPSRTRRLLSAPEIWCGRGFPDAHLVRTNFLLAELRDGHIVHYAGTTEHVLVGPTDHRRIRQKRTHLINADQAIGNISFIW